MNAAQPQNPSSSTAPHYCMPPFGRKEETSGIVAALRVGGGFLKLYHSSTESCHLSGFWSVALSRMRAGMFYVLLSD